MTARPANPHPRTRPHAGRDANLQRLGPHRHALAVTRRALFLLETTGAATGWAVLGKHHVAAHRAHRPGALARHAARFSHPLVATARARAAGILPRDGHGALYAVPRLLKSQRRPGVNVGTMVGTVSPLAPGTPREYFLEQLAERRRALRMDAAGKIKTGKAERRDFFFGDAIQLAGVIPTPAIGIDQRLVGIEHLPKSSLGLAIAGIDVGVQAARQPAIGFLDIAGRRLAFHPENDVQVHRLFFVIRYSLFLVVFHDFGVDHIAVVRLAPTVGRVRSTCRTSRT